MPRDQRDISHHRGTLHIETPLGIINVIVGLNDYHGRQVEAVEMIPCGAPRCPDKPRVIVRGRRFIQLKGK